LNVAFVRADDPRRRVQSIDVAQTRSGTYTKAATSETSALAAASWASALARSGRRTRSSAGSPGSIAGATRSVMPLPLVQHRTSPQWPRAAHASRRALRLSRAARGRARRGPRHGLCGPSRAVSCGSSGAGRGAHRGQSGSIPPSPTRPRRWAHPLNSRTDCLLRKSPARRGSPLGSRFQNHTARPRPTSEGSPSSNSDKTSSKMRRTLKCVSIVGGRRLGR
jgi:hypothetical protein